MEVQLNIDTRWKDNDDLPVLLDRTFKDEDDIAVKNPGRSDLIFREAEITIALISLVGAALSALIVGLVKIVETLKGNHVEIRGKNGRSIKIPAHCSTSKIQEYIKIARELDIEKITLE